MTELDAEEIADRIGVDPAVVRGLQDKTPEEHTIVDVHAYRNAIGIVELEEPISMNGPDPDPYALVCWDGYVFPFHKGDVENIEERRV